MIKNCYGWIFYTGRHNFYISLAIPTIARIKFAIYMFVKGITCYVFNSWHNYCFYIVFSSISLGRFSEEYYVNSFIWPTLEIILNDVLFMELNSTLHKWSFFIIYRLYNALQRTIPSFWGQVNYCKAYNFLLW